METPKERQCSKCEKIKPLTADHFAPDKKSLYRLTRQCRDCRVRKAAAWGRNDRRSDRLQLNLFTKQVKNYGKTVEWYVDILIEQNGLCAICHHLSHNGYIERLHIDHSHACCDKKRESCGECVRGLLCRLCNSEMGRLERVLRELDLHLSTIVPLAGTWLSDALQYLNKYQVCSSKTQETQ